jgi:hypothetical protein
MRRGLAAAAGTAVMLLMAACDDGRLDTIEGTAPGEARPADPTWDTLHPPVPSAPGVEAPAGEAPEEDGPGLDPAGMGEPGRTDVLTDG